jgi:hypothetical protein
MILDELGRARGTAKSFRQSIRATKKALERKRPDTFEKVIGQINSCFSSLAPFSINLSKEHRRRAGVNRNSVYVRLILEEALGDVDTSERVARRANLECSLRENHTAGSGGESQGSRTVSLRNTA